MKNLDKLFESIVKENNNIIKEDLNNSSIETEVKENFKSFLNRYWDCDEQKINDILNQLQSDFSEDKFTACEYIEKQFNTELMDTLAVQCPDQIIGFYQYVLKPELSLDNSFLGRYVSVSELQKKITSVQLPINVFNIICNKVAMNERNINEGKGEKLLITFFDNVSPRQDGDISINDLKGQVKGNEARIMGQKQYGEFKTTISRFKEIMKQLGYFNNEEIQKLVVNAPITDFYIPQILKNVSIYQKVYALCTDEQRIHLKNIIYDNYKEIFLDIERDTVSKRYLISFVDNIFNNLSACRDDFIKLSLLYYSYIDKWEYLVLVDNKGTQFNGFYADHISNIDNIVKRIDIKSWPSASASASKRNSVIQICIKK